MTRDTKGRFARAHQFIMTMIGYFIGITIFLFGTGLYVFFGMPVQASTSSVEQSGCVEYTKGRYDCSDPATRAKWASYLEGRNKELEGENGELRNEPEAILKAVCKDHGYTDDCWRVLYGIAMVESRMNPNTVGDSGNSLGFFQIHKGYHPGVPDSCRTDLRCSASWTLERMIRMGFDTDRETSIMLHNGTPNTAKTLEYLHKVKSYVE